MATISLPQSTLDAFQPISASAVHVLARMAARRAVQEQLRADGVRVSLVKPAEISAKGRGLSRRSSRIVSRSARACAAPGQWAFLLNETQERKSEQMTTIGYARVSTDGQTLAAQTEALHGAGCARIFAEKISGAYSDRPQLAKAIAVSAGGDCLVVCKLDRLARSTRDLLNTLDAIGKAGASFRSLADQWGRYNHPHGRLMLTVLGGLAEFERHLILSRTAEGRTRAQANGVRFGRKPSLSAYQRPQALPPLP
jgi:hypothetical protein